MHLDLTDEETAALAQELHEMVENDQIRKPLEYSSRVASCRGPQHDAAWCDEIASWRYPEAWDMLMFGLRLGNDPRVVVTTTPKPIKIIRELIADPTTAITRGSTYDNRGSTLRISQN